MQEWLEMILATKKVLEGSRPAVSPDALIGVVYLDQFPPDVFRGVSSEPLEQGMMVVCLPDQYLPGICFLCWSASDSLLLPASQRTSPASSDAL